MFYLDYGEFQIVGASPEVLVRVEDGNVMTRPLAGSRPRGKTPAEDAVLEQELRSDEKERAEHIVLVDLGRNDIGRVSEPGSVKVSELMEVERFSTSCTWSLMFRVNCGPNSTPSMPCVPVSGRDGLRRSQNPRRMPILAELEPEKPGPYARAVGYILFLRQYGYGHRHPDHRR